jgi:hypothetical protein
MNNHDGPQPTDGNGRDVYRNTLTIGSPAVADNLSVTAGSIGGVACVDGDPNPDAGAYGIHDVITRDGGTVCLYLPASAGDEVIRLTANGEEYGKSYTRTNSHDNPATQLLLCEIKLDKTDMQTFTAQDYGYAAQTPLTVTVTNAGSNATGILLTVSLTGDDANAFELQGTPIPPIAAGGSATFNVVPKTGLAASSCTATVEVSGANVVPALFQVSFTVNKKNITVSGGTVSPKTYDGTTVATVTGLAFGGLVLPDDNSNFVIDTDYKITADFTDASAGAGDRTVQVTVALENTAKANNYNLTGVPYDLTGQTIAKKNMTVTGGTVSPKTYDGTTVATVGGVSFGGLVSPDDNSNFVIDTDYKITAA